MDGWGASARRTTPHCSLNSMSPHRTYSCYLLTHLLTYTVVDVSGGAGIPYITEQTGNDKAADPELHINLKARLSKHGRLIRGDKGAAEGVNVLKLRKSGLLKRRAGFEVTFKHHLLRNEDFEALMAAMRLYAGCGEKGTPCISPRLLQALANMPMHFTLDLGLPPHHDRDSSRDNDDDDMLEDHDNDGPAMEEQASSCQQQPQREEPPMEEPPLEEPNTDVTGNLPIPAAGVDGVGHDVATAGGGPYYAHAHHICTIDFTAGVQGHGIIDLTAGVQGHGGIIDLTAGAQGQGTVEAPIYFSDSETESDDSNNMMGGQGGEVATDLQMPEPDMGIMEADSGGPQPPEPDMGIMEDDSGGPQPPEPDMGIMEDDGGGPPKTYGITGTLEDDSGGPQPPGPSGMNDITPRQDNVTPRQNNITPRQYSRKQNKPRHSLFQ